ncbi:ABC transporter substrate-binding protein [Consotaella aegiceratis]|uniref:ABC transporter substrate-binding protein n=1 Tax=Consotaella aegiceratis TaxID=3097961 RepID=UPI002F40B5F4
MRYLKTMVFAAGLLGLAASPALAEDTSLTMIVTEGADAAALRAVVDAYEAKHSDVHVNVQAYPFSQFFQVADLRLASKDSGIDLIYVDEPLVASYASRGFIEPFAAETDTSQLVDTVVEAGKYDGTLYALPINNSAQVLFVNRHLFEEAGIEPPAGLAPGDTATQAEVDDLAANKRWTWEQVADAAQKLTVKDGNRTTRYGFSVEQYGELYQLQPLGESLGLAVISEDGSTAEGYLDGEAWTEAATFWSNLYNDWGVSPRDLAFGQAPQMFVNEQLAMFVGGTWNISALIASGIDYVVAPHPYFEGGKVVTPTGSWYVGINAASGNKDVAADFAKYLTVDPEGTKAWFDSLQQLPTYTPLLDEIKTSDTYASFPANMFRLGVYESLNTAKVRPVTAAYGQLQDAFRSSFIDIANGVAVKDALADAVAKYDDAAKRVAQ